MSSSSMSLYHNACIFTCDPDCDGIELKHRLLFYTWFTVDSHGIIDRIGDGVPPADLFVDNIDNSSKINNNNNPVAVVRNRIIDCKGKFILPGLHDTHCHLYGVAHLVKVADLCHVSSIDRFIDILKTKLAAIGGPSAVRSFLEGSQWDQDEIGRLPTRYDLDQVSTEVPIICMRRCWHILVCNSKALEMCNVVTVNGIISSNVDVDIEGIDVDQNGRPTGILRENACKLLGDLLKIEDTWEEKLSFLGATLLALPKRGVVSVQSNDTAICAISDAWKVYTQLLHNDDCGDSGTLPVRVCWTSDGEIFQSQSVSTEDVIPAEKLGVISKETTASNTAGNTDDFLHHERAKLFLDGGLGASTAALFEDYMDEPTGNRGIINITDKQIEDSFIRAKAADLRIEAHAIGDRAFDTIFTKFENGTPGTGPGDTYLPGPSITHCQILNPNLLTRMATFYTKHHGKQNPLFTNIQPQFSKSDLPIIVPKLGTERAKTSYVWKTLQDSAKTIICGGSDAPVEELCPFTGIALAMRNPLHNTKENLDFADALAMYTKNASENGRFRDGSRCEQTAKKFSGCLTVGSVADFVILDFCSSSRIVDSSSPLLESQKQLLEEYILERTLNNAAVENAETGNTKIGTKVEVFRTYLAGKVVYDAEEDAVSMCADSTIPSRHDLFMPGRSGRPLWRCPCCN